MKSPFDKFVGKQVRVELNSNETCSGKLVSIEDGWLTLDGTGGQRVVRQDDIKGMSAEKVTDFECLYNVRIGRITYFDPETYVGHIQESGAGRDWSFNGDAVRDTLLVGTLLNGKEHQLVKFLPTMDFVQKGTLEVGEVKAVSHRALKAKSRFRRRLYEWIALMIFWIKDQRGMIPAKEYSGFVCDFNRRKAVGQIREDASDVTWSFYGNDIVDKNLFNRIYAGELGMQVLFRGHKRTSPGKMSEARCVRSTDDQVKPSLERGGTAIRTASGRISAYYIERGFGFVKEAQSDQIWFFRSQSLSADMQLQTSLMRGELNQFVTFSGNPQPLAGHEYPAIDSMRSSEAQIDPDATGEQRSAQRQMNMTYLDAARAEKRGDFQLAIDIYQKLLLDIKDPSRSNAVKGYAHLLNRLNRANEAVDIIEANRNLFDLKSRLGMLSIFYRKARKYIEAANIFRQLAFNIGLPKNDEKRISYLLQGAECFCEGGDFSAARDLLSYLPPQFDIHNPKYVTITARITAGLNLGDETKPFTAKNKNQGFQYPDLAKEHLETCRYVGLPHPRLVAGNFCRNDIKLVSSLFRGGASVHPPSVAAEYYLTMAKISDDIGESAMHYLYKHFLCSAAAAALDTATNPPRARKEDVMCDVVQAFCCAGNNKFFHERLWYVMIWAFSGSKEPISMDVIFGRFILGSLIRDAVERLKQDQDACNRLFQMLGMVRRNIPEDGFAFLIEVLKASGWEDVETRISKDDRYLGIEGSFADVLELEGVDERSLIDILSNLTSISGLPSSLDREFCTDFVNMLKMSSEYAAQQSSFIKCTEIFNQVQYMAKSLVEDARRSVLSVCLLKPAVRHLMDCIRSNYDKHKGIEPELYLELKYDDPDEHTCEIMDGTISLRFGVKSMNEAAPPVHNLQFAVLGEDSEVTRTEYMWPKEFTGEPVDFSLPSFKILDKELSAGEFSITVAISYDTMLGEHRDSKSSFSIKLASASSTWEEIYPNPYKETASGSQVSDDRMFFGRVKLVSDIVEVLRHPNGGQCFVLYGQKRSGKSSVLEAVCRRLIHTDEKCIISQISAQGLVVKGSKGSLFARFALMLSSRVRAEFNDHRLLVPKDFPTTAEIYDNPMDAMERFVQALRDEGFFWVITIDEFTSIHQESPDVVTSFMHNWKAMLQGRLFNALIVGQDTMPKFMDEHPNDFCVSNNIRLSYLNKSECAELASKPIEIKGRSRYLENSLDKIFDWTLGSPYLVQKFCNRLVERLNANHRTYVVDADIDGVAKSMCSGVDRMPEIEFDSFVTAGDEDWADFEKGTLKKVLIAVAKESRMTGWAPIESVVNSAEEYNAEKNFDLIVDDLVRRDALERFKGKLKVPVKLFAEWLRINM